MSITRLDAAASAAAATLAYSISAGSDRLLVVSLSAEDSVDPDVTAVDYGGQAMTEIRQELADAGGGVVGYVTVWYLLEAGIAAAIGTTITPTYADPPTDEIIHAASYAGVNQTTPVVEHQGDNSATSTPNPFTTVDLVESSGNMIMAAGVIGEPLPEGVASWQADLTEQTDQLDGSSASSMADRLATTEAEVQVELTWVGPVNRSAIISVHFAQVGFEPSCLREVSATDSPTSTSTSYVVIPGMEMTPGGGDYLAWFTASVNGDGALPGSIFIALFVDGTIVAHTEREIHFDSSMEATTFLFAATHALVQPTDGQVVDVRWFASSLTTMTVLQRTLNLIKLDAADVSEATATGDDTTTSATYVLAGSMILTPGAGKFALFFTCSAEGSGEGDDVRFAVFVNGVIVQHTERAWNQETSITDSEFCYAIAAEVNPTAGQDVEIRWFVQGGTGTVHERTLTLWKTEQIQEVSATGDTTTTSATFALLDSMELTPEAGEYLAIFTGYWEGGLSAAHDIDAVIVEGTTEIPHTQRTSGSDGSTPDMDHCVGSNGIVNLDGIEDVEIHWRRSVGDTATCHERTLILISCLAQVDKDAVDAVDIDFVEVAELLGLAEPTDQLDVDLAEDADLLGLAEPVDTLDIDLAEDALIDAEAEVQDDVDLDLGEDVEVLVPVDPDDTLDVDLGEDAETAVMIDPDDVLDIDLGEDAAGEVEGTAQDDVDVGLAEDAELLAAAEPDDTLDLDLGEDSETAVLVEDDDQLDLDLGEDAGVAVSIDPQDQLDVDLGEVARIAVEAGVQDTLDIEIDQAALISVVVSVVDLLDVSIDDVALVAGVVVALETLDLSLDEIAEVVSGVTLIFATDGLDISLNEVAEVVAAIQATDDLDITVDEVAEVVAAIQASDQLDLAIEQTAAIVATVSAIENLDVSLDELAEIAAVVEASDVLNLAIDDAGQVSVGITVDDTLDVALDELAELLGLLGVTDALDIELQEAAQILALISRSDTLDITIDDFGNVAVQVLAQDVIDLATDEAGVVVVGIVSQDTLDLATVETSELLAFLARADSLSLAIVEGSPVIFVQGNVEDTLGLEIVDLAAVNVPIVVSDVLNVATEDLAVVVAALQANDLIDLAVDEQAELAAALAVLDDLDLDLGEETDVAIMVDVLDQLDLTTDQAAATAAILVAADNLDISIDDVAQIIRAIGVVDSLDLELDEAGEIEILAPFQGIIVQPFTLTVCREVQFKLTVCREVRFTLQIEGSGVQP